MNNLWIFLYFSGFELWKCRWVAAQSVFYHLYNQVSYMSLNEISPLTFSIGNTMKRISVIVASIIIFQTPVQPVNALGAAIAIFGTFLYSQVQFFPSLSQHIRLFHTFIAISLWSTIHIVIDRWKGNSNVLVHVCAGKEVKTNRAGRMRKLVWNWPWSFASWCYEFRLEATASEVAHLSCHV